MNDKSTTYRNLPEDPCLTEAQLYGYIDGKLTPQEQHVVEKHVLDCDMCSDALDGLALVKNREKAAFVPPVANVKPAADQTKKTDDDNKGRIIPLFGARGRYAAAAALIILLGFAWFLKNNLSADKESSLSQNNAPALAEGKDEPSNAKMDSVAAPPAPAEKTGPEKNKQIADKKVATSNNDGVINGEAVPAVNQSSNYAADEAPLKESDKVVLKDALEQEQKTVLDGDNDAVSSGKEKAKDDRSFGAGFFKNNADTVQLTSDYYKAAPSDDSKNRLGLFSSNRQEESVTKKNKLQLDTRVKKERSYAFATPKAEAPNDFLRKNNDSSSGPIAGSTGSVKANQSGTYTVTVTDANGATSTESQDLTVNTNAPVQTTGTTSTSGGSSVTLSNASGAASYTWSPASNVNIPQMTTVAPADSIKVRNELEKKAEEDSERKSPVADSKPGDAAQYDRGVQLMKNNNIPAAIATFDQVLSNPKSPLFEDAQWQKAVALVRLNKKAEAKVVLEAIVKKGGKYKALAESQLKQF